jgi:hypothetical protein
MSQNKPFLIYNFEADISNITWGIRFRISTSYISNQAIKFNVSVVATNNYYFTSQTEWIPNSNIDSL